MYQRLSKVAVVALMAAFFHSTPAQAFGNTPLIVVVPVCDITGSVITLQSTYTGVVEAVDALDHSRIMPLGTFSATTVPDVERFMKVAARKYCANDELFFQISCVAVQYQATGSMSVTGRINC